MHDGLGGNSEAGPFTGENKFCSSCTSHEVGLIVYIIQLLSCNTPINDVDYKSQYFDMLVI